MAEWLDSFKHHIDERLNSPLVGAYLTSWPIVNYQALIVAFSDMKAQEKISFISNNIFGSPSDYAHHFGLPLLIAAFYIWVVPIPSRWALKYSLKQNKENRAVKQEIEDQILLTQEEARALQEKYKSEIDELEQDTKKMESKLSEFKEQIKLFESSTLDSTKQLSEAMAREHQVRGELAELQQRYENERTLFESIKVQNEALKNEKELLDNDFKNVLGGIVDFTTGSSSAELIDLRRNLIKLVRSMPEKANFLANYLESEQMTLRASNNIKNSVQEASSNSSENQKDSMQ